jgi:DNA-binding NtrC family response regulator
MTMLGTSEKLRAAKALLRKFSVCDEPILIEGETGTGKELAAREVHYASPRRDMPFIPVNCGAVPDTLFESEFFGHSRGAFTDARAEQRGLIGLAEGGTLFLDEIDALSVKGQVSLLRFLQDRVYRRIGAETSRVADLRIVAATNADLARLVDAGAFRADLLFRLRVLNVVMPPLRERVEDIALLAQHFLRACAQRYKMAEKALDGDVAAALERHPWPGNVRELESVICRAFLLADGPTVGFDAIPELRERGTQQDAAATATRFNQAKAAAISQFEVRYLSELMARAQGNVTIAAKLAGTERRHLGRLLKKHHISKDGFSSL